ncbi:zinc-dependent metalloprotease family protein [Halorarum halobium]|uniref:zinc-dependent metalloprotease family protein n=1 Tax=Halorarum halobium TaxID=3075121 RepID=UPI0028ACA72D|nr:zinc-dependent metalloprotease family protein [Halobaculum sp. XH14]
MSRAGRPPLARLGALAVGLAVLCSAVTVGYPVVAAQSELPNVDQLRNPAAADNPWEQSTVSVYVGHDESADAADVGFADRELDHWEAHASEYAGSNVSFERVEDRESADLVVLFREEVNCGPQRFAVGCAKRETVERTGTVTTATITVRTGYDDRVIRRTLRHEMGHVFGLDHEDRDEFPFMKGTVRVGSGE